jgi:hypothetical protein
MNVTIAIWLIVGTLLLPRSSSLTVFNHLLSCGAVLAFTWLNLLPQRSQPADRLRDDVDAR